MRNYRDVVSYQTTQKSSFRVIDSVIFGDKSALVQSIEGCVQKEGISGVVYHIIHCLLMLYHRETISDYQIKLYRF